MACLGVKSLDKIVRVWPCMLYVEQKSCMEVTMQRRAPNNTAPPLAQRTSIDGYFFAIPDGSGVARLAVWKSVHGITNSNVTFATVVYPIYTCAQTWTLHLNNCRLAGCCGVGDHDCFEEVGFGHP